MKTYYVTTSINRRSSVAEDALAICEQVNRRAGADGISDNRNAVQAIIDEYASAEDQALMGLHIDEDDFCDE